MNNKSNKVFDFMDFNSLLSGQIYMQEKMGRSYFTSFFTPKSLETSWNPSIWLRKRGVKDENPRFWYLNWLWVSTENA